MCNSPTSCLVFLLVCFSSFFTSFQLSVQKMPISSLCVEMLEHQPKRERNSSKSKGANCTQHSAVAAAALKALSLLLRVQTWLWELLRDRWLVYTYEFISLQTLCKDTFCKLAEVIWKQDQSAMGSVNCEVYYWSSLHSHDIKMLLHSVWIRWKCCLTCLRINSYFIVCLLSRWLWVLASHTIWVSLKFCEIIGINAACNFGWSKKFTQEPLKGYPSVAHLWICCGPVENSPKT